MKNWAGVLLFAFHCLAENTLEFSLDKESNQWVAAIAGGDNSIASELYNKMSAAQEYVGSGCCTVAFNDTIYWGPTTYNSPNGKGLTSRYSNSNCLMGPHIHTYMTTSGKRTKTTSFKAIITLRGYNDLNSQDADRGKVKIVISGKSAENIFKLLRDAEGIKKGNQNDIDQLNSASITCSRTENEGIICEFMVDKFIEN
jgi:hypothetical protein